MFVWEGNASSKISFKINGHSCYFLFFIKRKTCLSMNGGILSCSPKAKIVCFVRSTRFCYCWNVVSSLKTSVFLKYNSSSEVITNIQQTMFVFSACFVFLERISFRDARYISCIYVNLWWCLMVKFEVCDETSSVLFLCNNTCTVDG